MNLEWLKQLAGLQRLAAIKRAEDWDGTLPPAGQFELE